MISFSRNDPANRGKGEEGGRFVRFAPKGAAFCKKAEPGTVKQPFFMIVFFLLRYRRGPFQRKCVWGVFMISCHITVFMREIGFSFRKKVRPLTAPLFLVIIKRK